MSDDFREDLLTGDEKWWEFLDPQTYEVRSDLPNATYASSSALDWTRASRPTGPVGLGFYMHCSLCGQRVPGDFTFCVHCGGAPRSRQPVRTHTVVITDVEGEAARDAAAELVAQAGHGLEVAEVTRMFADLPVVFNVTAPRDQVVALAARLAEIGVSARAFSVDDPSIPWLRETAESLIRDTPKLLAGLAACAAGIVFAAFGHWIIAVPALLAVVGLFAYQLRWYRQRYHVDAPTMLQYLTGFDPQTAAVTRETLAQMADRDARRYVTVCLMEYYTLTQQFRAHGALYGDVLARAAEALEELMADVLTLAHRYARMDSFLRANPIPAVEQRLTDVEARSASDPSARTIFAAEAEALHGQLQKLRQMEGARAAFREQLVALAEAMESMRRRFAAVRAQPSAEAFRDLAIAEALQELEDEFAIFEETMQVLA